MNPAEISLYRPVLHSIAYKIVGCAAVAEDMVQDAFLNLLKIDQENIINLKAYLIKSVTNACFSHLDSFRQKKGDFLENLNPSISMFAINPDFNYIDLKHELTDAFTQVFRKLHPTERAVFVLKGLFNFDYSDLTEVLDKKADNCRQLFCRAQQKLTEEKGRFNIDTERVFKMVEEFRMATLGEFSDLIDGLKKDILSEKVIEKE